MINPIIEIKTFLPPSLARLPSYTKLLLLTETRVPNGESENPIELIQRQNALNNQILQERLHEGGKLPSKTLFRLLDENNYGDCRHIATAVNRVLQENADELNSLMPSSIVVLMWRRNYYTMMANFVSAPLLHHSRVKNMDELTLQSFRKSCSNQASPGHVFNVLNLPKDLAKALDQKEKLFLSTDFRELGNESIIIDPWLTDDLVFLSSEANNRYQGSFNCSYPVVMLLKPEHPINSICLW